MKSISSITIKIKTDVSLLTIIKWRLLGLHKLKSNMYLLEGYTGKNSKLFRVEVDNENES